jgi:hypothetical protein
MNYIVFCRKTNNRLSFEFESCELLEKTEGVMKNGQSRDIGNIGYIRHRTKTSITQKTNRISNTDLTENWG